MIFFPVNFLMASQVIGLPGSILALSAKCPPPLVWIKSIFLESLKKTPPLVHVIPWAYVP
jgi:hypothetical protein